MLINNILKRSGKDISSFLMKDWMIEVADLERSKSWLLKNYKLLCDLIIH